MNTMFVHFLIGGQFNGRVESSGPSQPTMHPLAYVEASCPSEPTAFLFSMFGSAPTISTSVSFMVLIDQWAEAELWNPWRAWYIPSILNEDKNEAVLIL